MERESTSLLTLLARRLSLCVHRGNRDDHVAAGAAAVYVLAYPRRLGGRRAADVVSYAGQVPIQ